MLDGLDSINWTHYCHAYGSAADIPSLIRALTSPDNEVRGRACYNLMNNLAHQGTRWEASHFAVPFLCELVKDTSTPDRSSVMTCMFRIALGDNWLDDSTLPYPSRRFDPVQSMVSAEYHHITATMFDTEDEQSGDNAAILDKLAFIWERDAYTAMSNYAHELLTLGMDNDPAVARYAISSIPWFPDTHRDAVPVLIRLLSAHPSIETRTTAALTAGLLSIPDYDLVETIVQHTLDSKQSHLLQLAGAVALAFLKGADADVRVLDILVDAADWREEISAVGDGIPYPRALMGFRSTALSHLGF
ncbi:MAG: hypothetical protein R3E39_01440 [Anaerolineae bacterium]